MGIYFFLTTREKLMIIGVAGLLVLVLIGGALVVAFRMAPSQPPVQEPSFVSNLTDVLLSLEMEPQIIEKEVYVHVPASYLTVDGKNYTTSDVMTLLEVKSLNLISFDKWIYQLFTIAQSQMSFHFNGLVYGPGEYDVEDIEPNDCVIEFELGGFDEGLLQCDNVELETSNSIDLECKVEIFFERNNKYEMGKIKSCDYDKT